MQGWLNTDLPTGHRIDFPLDITRSLPLPDNAFHVIYASEVIEHIPRHAAFTFLRQAHRILQPGGTLRLTTPDIPAICRIYLNQHEQVAVDDFQKVWVDGEFSPEIWINTQFRGYGHQFLWTEHALDEALRQAGFSQTARCQPQQTELGPQQLSNLEQRYGQNAPEWIFARTLIMEAKKADNA